MGDVLTSQGGHKSWERGGDAISTGLFLPHFMINNKE
jgi:hypothetical protein